MNDDNDTAAATATVADRLYETGWYNLSVRLRNNQASPRETLVALERDILRQGDGLTPSEDVALSTLRALVALSEVAS